MNVALMMTEKVEQYICIKFCQKLGQSCSKNYDMIQNIEAMGYTQGKEWFRQFKEGQLSGERDEYS